MSDDDTTQSSSANLPPPQINNFPSGANNIHDAGYVIGQQKTDSQMKLISVGGRRKRKTKQKKTKKTVKFNLQKNTYTKKHTHKKKMPHTQTPIALTRRRYIKKNKNKKVTNRAKYVRGKNIKYMKGGEGIPVHEVHVPYTEQVSGNQSTTGTLTNLTQTNADAHANREYDDCVGKTQEQCNNTK